MKTGTDEVKEYITKEGTKLYKRLQEGYQRQPLAYNVVFLTGTVVSVEKIELRPPKRGRRKKAESPEAASEPVWVYLILMETDKAGGGTEILSDSDPALCHVVTHDATTEVVDDLVERSDLHPGSKIWVMGWLFGVLFTVAEHVSIVMEQQ